MPIAATSLRKSSYQSPREKKKSLVEGYSRYGGSSKRHSILPSITGPIPIVQRRASSLLMEECPEEEEVNPIEEVENEITLPDE